MADAIDENDYEHDGSDLPEPTGQPTEDMARKLADPLWRLNNLYKIKDKTGKVVTFRMNWAQQRLYDNMWYFNTILKARQLGFTTFIQIFILDRCLFEDNTQAAVIAHNLEDAKAFFYDKIKFAYDNLPEEVQSWRPYTARSAREMIFSNGSRIRVGTSARSGTIQYLHISEFGKICAKWPENAKEIMNGSLPAVPLGGFVFMESTAEGNKGHFHDICRRAEKLTKAVDAGNALMTQRDFKFHFFPWYEHPEYVIEQRDIPLDPEITEYFEQFEAEHGVHVDRAYRLFYQVESVGLGEDMKQEYPGTPDEAFERLLKGAIFGVQIKKARAEGRFTSLPIEPGVRVNTFWDLGRNDFMSIWFHQRLGPWDHFIDYYEYRLVEMPHYLGVLEAKQHEYNWVYGCHYLPHDGRNKNHTSVAGSAEDILKHGGFKPVQIVDRPLIKKHSIDAARIAFARCRFDKDRCEDGIVALENYQWIWDEDHKTFRKHPQDNWASHGADAFQQFGLGYQGDRSSFAEQARRHVDGASGRKYSRRSSVHNPLTNPSTSHLT